MSCDFPITAYYSKHVNPSGKRSLVFRVQDSLSGIPLQVPCNKCIGCKLEKSRVWAIRCMHESKMHPENSFLTFTYDPNHLPASGSLYLEHLQLFMKRLRIFVFRKTGRLIKHYSCGEYGDLNKRPHYHVILFGYDFNDKLLYSTSSRGDRIFTSATLDGIWGMGSCKIGEVNFETAAYVARYCLKKVDGAKRDAGHYVVYDMDGVLHDRLPEFAVMSTRGGGIAASYYEKYGSEVRAHDSLVVKGKVVPSIRYYDKFFETLDPEGFKRVKRKRHPVAKYGRKIFLLESSSYRMRAKAQLKELMLKQKARKL